MGRFLLRALIANGFVRLPEKLTRTEPVPRQGTLLEACVAEPAEVRRVETLDRIEAVVADLVGPSLAGEHAVCFDLNETPRSAPQQVAAAGMGERPSVALAPLQVANRPSRAPSPAALRWVARRRLRSRR